MSTFGFQVRARTAAHTTGARFGATVAAASITGALLVEIPLLLSGTVTWPTSYAWIASLALGKGVLTNSLAAFFGVLVHLGVSFVWTIVYAALAQSSAAVGARPVTSGLAYGVVVYAGMQLLLAAAGVWQAPTASSFALAVVDHTVFFGLPVALIIARNFRAERSN